MRYPVAVKGIVYRDDASKWLSFQLKSPCCNALLGKNIIHEVARNLARNHKNIPFKHFTCSECDKALAPTPAIKDSRFSFTLGQAEDSDVDILTSWVEEFTSIGYMESLLLADAALRLIMPAALEWQESFKDFYLEGEVYQHGIALENTSTSLRILTDT